MCFSATASFAAAGVLGLTGVITLHSAYKTPMKWYAAIPLLFGIQQAIEGVQWLLERPSAACSVAGYGFLFFAFILWPVYVPFAMYAMEKVQSRRRILKWLTWFGATGSVYLLYWYLTSPLSISVIQDSIHYSMYVPFAAIGTLMYALAVSSGIFSSRPRVQLFSFIVFAGGFASYIMYNYAFTSTWCYFAALSSVLVLVEVKYASPSPKIKRRV